MNIGEGVEMQFVIVGGGAVGLVMANYLAELGHTVELLVHSEKQRLAIQNNGVTFTNCYGKQSVRRFVVSTNVEDLQKHAIWIIAVKYHHLDNLQPLFHYLPEETELLFIQNGIRHVEFAKNLKQISILMGSVEFGAEKIDQHNVIHRGIGTLKIAKFRGDSSITKKYLLLNTSEFPVAIVDDYSEMLLRKALVNCFINTLTTILKVKNGSLIENVYSAKLLKQLYQEVMIAFPEQKDGLSFKNVEVVCKSTAQNTSSMLTDYLNGRKMEIDTIIGGIIEVAKKRGYDLPILSTCYTLLQAMQGGARN